jgi:hypothetical protein
MDSVTKRTALALFTFFYNYCIFMNIFLAVKVNLNMPFLSVGTVFWHWTSSTHKCLQLLLSILILEYETSSSFYDFMVKASVTEQSKSFCILVSKKRFFLCICARLSASIVLSLSNFIPCPYFSLNTILTLHSPPFQMFHSLEMLI